MLSARRHVCGAQRTHVIAELCTKVAERCACSGVEARQETHWKAWFPKRKLNSFHGSAGTPHCSFCSAALQRSAVSGSTDGRRGGPPSRGRGAGAEWWRGNVAHHGWGKRLMLHHQLRPGCLRSRCQVDNAGWCSRGHGGETTHAGSFSRGFDGVF